jgi:heme/copper-type cytochrome/quinol oxidase subunit 2
MIPPTLVASIGAPPLAQLRMLYDRDPSMFKTAGPMAAGIATLGWTMIILATIVFLIVMTVLLLPLWRRRNAPPVDGPPLPVNERAWLLYAGTAAPALILAGIFVLTFGVYRAHRRRDPPPGGSAGEDRAALRRRDPQFLGAEPRGQDRRDPRRGQRDVAGS